MRWVPRVDTLLVRPIATPRLPPALMGLMSCDTFILPPDDQWPRVLLPAWPPYFEPPKPGSMVCIRGSRGYPARVASGDEDDDELISVEVVSGPKVGVRTRVNRRKAEIMRGRTPSQRPAILLCGETDSFRRLARSQVLATDEVIEIGCSYGLATELLAARARKVLAIDVSEDALRRSKERLQRFENVRFENLDALRMNERARLWHLASQMSTTVLFVDINGDRTSTAVAPLLSDLHDELRPTVTIVKNRQLYEAAAVHQQACTGQGGWQDAAKLPSSEKFWHAATIAAAAPGKVRGAQRARPPDDAGHPADSVEERELVSQWRATAGTHATARTLFSAPSTMDARMRVEVRERPGGWRTMHLVGECTRREVMHGVTKVDRESGAVQPGVMPSEYLKSMAALALATRERRALPARPGIGSSGHLRCLFLGIGAGALPKLFAHYLPGAELVAVECDDAVCEAAVRHLGLRQELTHIVKADALQWVKDRAAAGEAAEGFDVVFTDIFDERNLCPAAFWSHSFLTSLGRIMSDTGVVIHNFHAGSKALNLDVVEAQAAYASVFGAAHCCRVASLDSQPWAGNAVLAASKDEEAASIFSPPELAKAARRARKRWNLGFDLAARCALVEVQPPPEACQL